MSKVLMCEKVEVLGKKDGKEKVIAVVSVKNDKVIVESEDKEFKKNAEEFLNTGEHYMRGSYTDKHGYKKMVLTPQQPKDHYFLLAIIGWWSGGGINAKVTDEEELWGYTHVHAGRAGKIWEKELPEGFYGE